MDLTKIINDLRMDIETQQQALKALMSIQAGGGKRRGRPPKWMSKPMEVATVGKKRGRPPKAITESAA